MKDIILMAVYTLSLYNSNICLHVNGTFAHMPVTHDVCSAAPPYHDRRLLLLLSLMKVWMVPLVWDWELEIHFSRKQVEMWTHLSTAHFHCLFDYQQHRFIELMYSFLLQIFKLHFLMQQQTVVNDSGFLKYSWANVAIFNTAAWWFLMQCHLKAQRSSTFNWGFLHCDFSGFPESFHNITYGTWWKN